MAANGLDLSYSEIKSYTSRKVLWGTSLTSQQSIDFTNALKRGLRKAYYPSPLPGEGRAHKWSFLEPKGSIRLQQSITGTGTESVSENAASLSSGALAHLTWLGSWDPGNFPAAILNDPAGWVFNVTQDDVKYQVTILALVTNSSATTDYYNQDEEDAFVEAGYTAHKLYYDLPDDYAGMASNAVTLRRDQTVLGQVPVVNEQAIRRYEDVSSTGAPQFVTVVPVAATSSETTRWQLRVYPSPDANYELEYRYVAIPPALDSTTNIYHWGGAPFSEVIMAAVADEAMMLVRDSNELHGDYMEALQRAVFHDRQNHTPHTLGYGSQSLGAPGGVSTDTLERYLRYRGEGTPYANITYSG